MSDNETQERPKNKGKVCMLQRIYAYLTQN